jgi:hypothetical protein
LSEIIVYVNVTHHKTIVLKVNMKKLEWVKCLCKCYTSQKLLFVCQSKYEKLKWHECLCKCCTSTISLLLSKKIWKILSDISVYENVTHHIAVILKSNIEKSCKCYKSYHCYSQSKNMKICSEMNVYVNVTHDMTVTLKVKTWKICSDLNV